MRILGEVPKSISVNQQSASASRVHLQKGHCPPPSSILPSTTALPHNIIHRFFQPTLVIVRSSLTSRIDFCILIAPLSQTQKCLPSPLTRSPPLRLPPLPPRHRRRRMPQARRPQPLARRRSAPRPERRHTLPTSTRVSHDASSFFHFSTLSRGGVGIERDIWPTQPPKFSILATWTFGAASLTIPQS